MVCVLGREKKLRPFCACAKLRSDPASNPELSTRWLMDFRSGFAGGGATSGTRAGGINHSSLHRGHPNFGSCSSSIGGYNNTGGTGTGSYSGSKANRQSNTAGLSGLMAAHHEHEATMTTQGCAVMNETDFSLYNYMYDRASRTLRFTGQSVPPTPEWERALWQQIVQAEMRNANREPTALSNQRFRSGYAAVGDRGCAVLIA